MISILSFFGNNTLIDSIFFCSVIAKIAAFDAAVAHVPVVNPFLNFPLGFSVKSTIQMNFLS